MLHNKSKGGAKPEVMKTTNESTSENIMSDIGFLKSDSVDKFVDNFSQFLRVRNAKISN
jgi:hypothetical protein